jgi:hypothetical protein
MMDLTWEELNQLQSKAMEKEDENARVGEIFASL